VTQFSTLYTARLDEELGTDDSTVLFTTARRKAAINRGVAEFADLAECFVKWSTIACTGTVGEYDLLQSSVLGATDFVRLAKEPIEFQYTDASSNVTVLAGQDDLPHRSIKWLDDYEPGWRLSTVASTQMQLPMLTYERPDGGARYLGFWPTPSTGSSAAIVARVPYVAAPPVLTSDTSEPYSGRVDLRSFHQAAVHYAAHQLEKLRRDDQASDRQLQKFLGYVARYAQSIRKKGGNTVTQARSYFTRNRFRATNASEDPRT